VPCVHFSGSREVFLAGREQRAQSRVRQANSYPDSDPSPRARRRHGPAPTGRTTRHRLRRDGDGGKTVILSITRALRLHGFRVNG
jgi:hypothetical protein